MPGSGAGWNFLLLSVVMISKFSLILHSHFPLQGPLSLFIILQVPEVKFMPLQKSNPRLKLGTIPTWGLREFLIGTLMMLRLS